MAVLSVPSPQSFLVTLQPFFNLCIRACVRMCDLSQLACNKMATVIVADRKESLRAVWSKEYGIWMVLFFALSLYTQIQWDVEW